MKNFLLILMVLGGLVLTACSIAAPKRLSEKSSAIGLTVEFVPPAGAIFDHSFEAVIFIRLHEDGGYDYTASSLPIPSNFSRGGQIFLLNAKPGRYAVIIGHHTTQIQSITFLFATYFPEEILKVSEVEIPPNKFVFMGKYKIDLSLSRKNMDSMQSYFFHLLDTGKRAIPGVYRGKKFHVAYKGKILEANRSQKAEVAFLKNAVEPNFFLNTFKDSGWEILLNKRLAELK